MRVRAMDANGDAQFGRSQLQFLVNSPEAVAQIVETVLRFWLGEWYLNVDEGTPYVQGVIGKNTKETSDQTIIAQISTIEWVEGITNFQSEIDPNTRKYSVVKGTIFTPFGSTKFQFTNLGVIQ